MGGWNFIDKTGMKFGKLTVVKYLGNKQWLCKCECGNYTVVNSDHLSLSNKRRSTKSCGCLLASRAINNENFFETIDTEAKAYYLGLLASDGTITFNEEKKQYSIKLVLNSIDKHIIKSFKKAVDTSTEVKTYKTLTKLPQGTQKESEMSSLLLCSKKMTQDVMKYGVVPRKSLTLDIKYELIPNSLLKDFWRGLFDGDGTFGKFGKKEIISVGLTTSQNMCISTIEKIKETFPDIHINYYHRKDCNEATCNLVITNQQDCINFLKYIYQDSENSEFKLKRKYEKFLKIIQAQTTIS